MAHPSAPVRIAAALGVGALGLLAWRRLRDRARRRRAERLDRYAVDETCLVGLVGARDARLWYRIARPGPLTLTLRGGAHQRRWTLEPRWEPDADGTGAVRVPADLPGAAALEPNTRYRFALSHADGRPIGEGAFHTAPLGAQDAPDRVVFGVASCHQPFDERGRLVPRSLAMLRVAEEVLEDWDVKRLLLVGDQMYADLPGSCSLFDERWFREVGPPGRASILDCTAEEVRGLYQRRHRIFLGVGPWLRLQQRRACLPMFDDHDIVDNFGSAPDHGGVRWAALRQGALDACHDYQLLRIGPRPRPPSAHYAFDYGPIGVFVMDLRSERRWEGDELRIVSDAQLDELRRWLAAHEEDEVVILALTVPLVHVPDWLAWLGVRVTGEAHDAADRWSQPRALRARQELLDLLRAHARRAEQQRVVILGGDVHVGCGMVLEWDDGRAEPIVQLVSSAVSNLENPIVRSAASMLTQLGASSFPDGEGLGEVRLLEGIGPDDLNPYSGLNIGLLEVRRGGGRPLLRWVLVGHTDEQPPRPRVVFDSGEI